MIASPTVDTPTRPVPIAYAFDNIPAELKAVPQWCGWRYEFRDKWTKPPLRGDGKGRASSTDPATWSDYQTAVATQQRGDFDGIGFVLTPTIEIVGVDLDHCYNPDSKSFEPWATAIIDHFESYTEVSPSGTGVRIFLKGKLPAGGHKKGNVEIYSSGRYLTVTGRVLKTHSPRVVEPRQAELDAFLAEHFPEPKIEKRASAAFNGNGHSDWNPTDDQLLTKAFAAKNGGKIQALFDGDFSAYPSQSEADQALCSMLAFWAQDRAQLDRLFRRSALIRDKWDERHGAQTYGERTIEKAFTGSLEHYEPRHNGGNFVNSFNSSGVQAQPNHLTDLGNAQRFATLHNGNVLYSATRRKWIVWNDCRWEWDLTGKVQDLAIETIKTLYSEAANHPDKDMREALSLHAIKSEARGKIESMLALAQAMPEIRTDLERFDRHPFLFNCPNATIDLTTSKARPHRREDYITKMSPTIFNPGAVCPMFEKFLGEVLLGDKDLELFVQRAAGHSLTGDTSEHALFLAFGGGFNGKSTLINLLARVAGEDYAKELKAEVLLEGHDNKDAHLAELVGVRMVVCLESDRDRKMSVGIVKAMTGGDKIPCCKKYENPFSFQPEFKIWFGTNHRPKITDTTNSIWNRIKTIPFLAEFLPDDPKTIKNLPELIATQEAEGVLAWMVRGVVEWRKLGLAAPERVKEATAEYRHDEDIVGGFVAECCTVQAGASEPIKRLYSEYVNWCAQSGEKPDNKKTFGIALTEQGFAADRVHVGRVRLGLCLKNDTEERAA